MRKNFLTPEKYFRHTIILFNNDYSEACKKQKVTNYTPDSSKPAKIYKEKAHINLLTTLILKNMINSFKILDGHFY